MWYFCILLKITCLALFIFLYDVLPNFQNLQKKKMSVSFWDNLWAYFSDCEMLQAKNIAMYAILMNVYVYS